MKNIITEAQTRVLASEILFNETNQNSIKELFQPDNPDLHYKRPDQPRDNKDHLEIPIDPSKIVTNNIITSVPSIDKDYTPANVIEMSDVVKLLIRKNCKEHDIKSVWTKIYSIVKDIKGDK